MIAEATLRYGQIRGGNEAHLRVVRIVGPDETANRLRCV